MALISFKLEWRLSILRDIIHLSMVDEYPVQLRHRAQEIGGRISVTCFENPYERNVCEAISCFQDLIPPPV